MTHWPFHVSCFVLVWKVLVLYLGASQFIIDEFSFPFLASLLLSLKIQESLLARQKKLYIAKALVHRLMAGWHINGT